MLLRKLISHVNKKEWWHCPPQAPTAYKQRGKFYASSFREAEFWGRPIDEPQKVTIANPLVGDEQSIERKLFGKVAPRRDIPLEERWELDAKMKITALAKGFDSIVLMTPKGFATFRKTGRIPRSMELNVLNINVEDN